MADGMKSAAMQTLWELSGPETMQRLKVLQTTADDLARSRTIETAPRLEAASVAHHLASALALFGMRDAVGLARDVEATLDHPGLPQPERLQQQVKALSAAVQSHMG